MAKTFFIALGDKANGFYDQTTGINVARGEKVEITETQRNSRRIALALNAGALRLVQPDQKVEAFSENDLKNLDKKLRNQVKNGATIDKVIKGMTLEQARAIAEYHEIEVEDNDTIKDLIEAVIEDFETEK